MIYFILTNMAQGYQLGHHTSITSLLICGDHISYLWGSPCDLWRSPLSALVCVLFSHHTLTESHSRYPSHRLTIDSLVLYILFNHLSIISEGRLYPYLHI